LADVFVGATETAATPNRSVGLVKNGTTNGNYHNVNLRTLYPAGASRQWEEHVAHLSSENTTLMQELENAKAECEKLRRLAHEAKTTTTLKETEHAKAARIELLEELKREQQVSR